MMSEPEFEEQTARDSDLLNLAYPESLQDVDDLIDHT